MRYGIHLRAPATRLTRREPLLCSIFKSSAGALPSVDLLMMLCGDNGYSSLLSLIGYTFQSDLTGRRQLTFASIELQHSECGEQDRKDLYSRSFCDLDRDPGSPKYEHTQR